MAREEEEEREEKDELADARSVWEDDNAEVTWASEERDVECSSFMAARDASNVATLDRNTVFSSSISLAMERCDSNSARSDRDIMFVELETFLVNSNNSGRIDTSWSLTEIDSVIFAINELHAKSSILKTLTR